MNARKPERPVPAPRHARNALWLLRMAGVALCFAIVSVALLPVALLRFRDARNNALFVRILTPIARRILGLEVECRGMTSDRFREPSVLVMNHQASLDILLNSDFYPERCVVIAKKSLLLIPVFGWFFFLAGNLLINRTNRRQSLSQLEVAEKAMKERGLCIWIFPEGTRSLDRGLGKFKKGAFHLALKTQAPLVPVVSSSYYGRLDFGRWKSGTVLVEVLEPISTRELQASDLGPLIENTEEKMRSAIAALDAELAMRAPREEISRALARARP